MSDTKIWMDSVQLKLNLDKTEFIYFGTTHQLKKYLIDSVDVNGNHIIRSETLQYLGAFLDQLLNFKAHMKQKCRTAMSNLIWIRNICKFLTKDTCATLMLGLVVSHLDYCNSILVRVFKVTFNQLQRIQNMAAKVTLGRDKSASANEALFDLHWLPVAERIDFKVATMVFKCLNGEAPKYLCELIEVKNCKGKDCSLNQKQMMSISHLSRLKHWQNDRFLFMVLKHGMLSQKKSNSVKILIV